MFNENYFIKYLGTLKYIIVKFIRINRRTTYLHNFEFVSYILSCIILNLNSLYISMKF